MSTGQDLINETKRYLLAGHREQINQLSADITSGPTTINFNYPLGSIASGSTLSVDLEIMYVWDTDDSARSALVQRGYMGSTSTTHSSSALVTVNPKFPDFSIFQAINADINDISGDIFAVKTSTFTYVPSRIGYDLNVPAGVNPIGILDARYDVPGASRDWPLIHQFSLRRNSNLTAFPSGYQVNVWTGFPGREVRINYSANLRPLTASTDDVEAISGLPGDSHDIPALGAAVRLQGVREGQRNFNEAQPDSRRATEVPPGANMGAIRAMQDMRQRRIQGTMKGQRSQYPYHTKLMD